MITVLSAQTVCAFMFFICVCMYLDVQACMPTCRAPMFWFLLKTVTGPHCSINDFYDKRAAPSGALVHNPFPKYLASRTWSIFLSLEIYIQYKQEVRGKAMLDIYFLWGLLLLVSLVCYIHLTLVILHWNLRCFFPKRLFPLRKSLHLHFILNWSFTIWCL